jgi:hypothetical protein
MLLQKKPEAVDLQKEAVFHFLMQYQSESSLS